MKFSTFNSSLHPSQAALLGDWSVWYHYLGVQGATHCHDTSLGPWSLCVRRVHDDHYTCIGLSSPFLLTIPVPSLNPVEARPIPIVNNAISIIMRGEDQ